MVIFLTYLTFSKSLVLIHNIRGLKYTAIKTLLHDSMYETARRCAILPSRLHMHEVETMSKTLVNGGGFADIYKGTLSDGQVIAMKVPRCFGKPNEIRKVHAVSFLCISYQNFILYI